MPCVDHDEPPNYQTQCDNLAAMLCKACALIEEHGLYEQLPPSIKSWYSPHKISDKKREKLEGPGMVERRPGFRGGQ